MIYGSVCSGIEAASVAWEPLGWTPAFFSEIEPFPRAVLARRWPGVACHGDFTTIRAGEYGAIDLLVGGTPCQSFSVAGLRGGLGDGRGNLALEYLRLADRLRPRWLVWENVPGVLSSNGGRDFGAILGGMVELGYGFAYRVLDAQYVRVDGLERAVPQRRRRVFVVGYLGDWRRAAAVLFERESLLGHPPPRREAQQNTTASVARGPASSCAVSGCGRVAAKRGWCETHYQRWRTTGTVGGAKIASPGQALMARFWEKVDKSGPCWVWTAAKNEKGYGIFWTGKEWGNIRAHRFAYEVVHGEIADGLQIDHLCRNPACCKPEHLEAVTPQENTQRGDAGKHWAEKRGEPVDYAIAKVSPTIPARSLGGGGLGTDFDLDGGLIQSNSGEVGYCLTASAQQSLDAETETLVAVAHSLRGEGFDASGTCSVGGCDKKLHAGGFCKPHYSRFKRHGDPLTGRTSEGEPLAFLMDRVMHSDDACVEWPYAHLATGYPSIEYQGKTQRAHRVMCALAHGEPPSPALDAAHSCGVRSCINPRHLRWDTRTGNMADAIAHGTTTKGEKHGASVLSEAQVREIDARLTAGETHQSIADGFGVSRNAVTDISKGKNWSWLTGRGVQEVSHALLGEGFDGSADGTGRGTPLVPGAFTAKDYGGDASPGVSPTLRAGGFAGSHANAGCEGCPPPGSQPYEQRADEPGADLPKLSCEGTPDEDAVQHLWRTLEGARLLQQASDTLAKVWRPVGEENPASEEMHGMRFSCALEVALREALHAGEASGNASNLLTDRSDVASGKGGDGVYAVRRLTPRLRECERLMGFPDDFTRIPWRGKPADACPDGPRYKALGNSMAVNCMRWIGRRIEMVERLPTPREENHQ